MYIIYIFIRTQQLGLTIGARCFYSKHDVTFWVLVVCFSSRSPPAAIIIGFSFNSFLPDSTFTLLRGGGWWGEEKISYLFSTNGIILKRLLNFVFFFLIFFSKYIIWFFFKRVYNRIICFDQSALQKFIE